MTSDEDRIAYLAGDSPGSLDDFDQADLDELKALLADPALWEEPSVELEEAIVSAIQADGAGSGARPVTAVPPPPPSAPSLPARERARRTWLRPVAAAGALAAAAAVVIGVVVVSGDDTERDHLEAALPNGHADLTKFDGGWRIELDVAGLPRRENGEFYEAWLRNADGVLVSIGTFNEGNDVTLWAGVSPRDFNTLTITRELADGDPASSGDRVVAAPITED